MKDCLQLFSDGTAGWFREKLGEPTRVQEASWPAIAAGGHVLVSAPTGTGKTLSAFLVFLDRLKTRAMEGKLPRELQLVYVSPLKSLAADIRENLRKPLEGIGGQELLSVAVRTGDTTPRERQQMVRKPPHILIITPESLYLMLTSKTGQNVLCTAGAVIIDELHALIDTKRGAHLMLSLARLDALCGRHLQRIGLSATIAPLDRAARYLAPEAVTVAAVDGQRRPIPGTEERIPCDTLLLSVGLIPENELTRQAGIAMDRRTNGAVVYENMETSLPGVFACGNVCHVHDLVDFVTAESQKAGAAAAQYVRGGGAAAGETVLEVTNGDGVTYTVPQKLRPRRVEKLCGLFFRVNRVLGNSEILVTSGDTQIARFQREHLAPGEMERIDLPRALLDRAEGEITVSVREVEQ